MSEYVLYHFGVKGMKWGIRRFQKKDGTLTAAGKKRYSDDSPKTYKIPAKKSYHRLTLEQQCRDNGMTQEQAEQSAAKRLRIEKTIAVAAGLTIAAGAAYYLHHKYAVDKVINKSTEFQRIIKLNAGDKVHAGTQYVAYDTRDKTKYKGLLGDTFRTQRKYGLHNQDIQSLKVSMQDDVKVASSKRARDTFAKLYKDNKEFRDAVMESNNEMIKDLNGTPAGKLYKNVITKSSKGADLNNIHLKTKGYDAFNVGLVNRSESGSKAANMFYDALKKQGINAIEDINDQKYSGYQSKHPLIIFGGKYNYSGKVMTDQSIQSNLNAAMKDIYASQAKKEFGKAAVIPGALGVATVAATRRANANYINAYRKKHPRSKLSNQEILEIAYKEGYQVST